MELKLLHSRRSYFVGSLLTLSLIIAACGGGDDSSVSDAEDVSSPPPASTATVRPTAQPTSTPKPTLASTATSVPTATAVPPTSTAQPTSVPSATPAPTPTIVPTVEPTSTPIPTATPTLGPPTPIPTATPVGFSQFNGTGNVETSNFDSPPNLPWVIEWEAQGVGANSINVTLMDPEPKTEIIELVSDSGTGQIGGINLVVGNMGTFYLKVEGPESGWTIWIRQQ